MANEYIEDSGGIKPSNTEEKSLGMAWYKFLKSFALVAGAVFNFIYSTGYLSGSVYLTETNGAITAEQVYKYYGGGLQALDVIYGFFLIGFGILGIVLRSKLASYEPDAPKLVKVFYSLSAGVPFLYAITASAITELSISSNAIVLFIFGLIFLFANVKYFNKRAYLFVDKTENGANAAQAMPTAIINTPISTSPQAQPETIVTLGDHKFCLSRAGEQPTKHGNYDIYGKDLIVSPTLADTTPTQEQITTVAKKPVEILFCRKCGTKLFDDSVFCHKCGTKIK